jgi:hypothetical protein
LRWLFEDFACDEHYPQLFIQHQNREVSIRTNSTCLTLMGDGPHRINYAAELISGTKIVSRATSNASAESFFPTSSLRAPGLVPVLGSFRQARKAVFIAYSIILDFARMLQCYFFVPLYNIFLRHIFSISLSALIHSRFVCVQG